LPFTEKALLMEFAFMKLGFAASEGGGSPAVCACECVGYCW